MTSADTRVESRDNLWRKAFRKYCHDRVGLWALAIVDPLNDHDTVYPFSSTLQERATDMYRRKHPLTA